MGYDLHITRKQDWSQEEGPTISREEVVAYFDSIDDFQVASEYSNDGEMMFAWMGSPERGWVMHIDDEGELLSKNPSEDLVRRLWLIAQDLGAQLHGDDGELYRQDGTGCHEGEDHEAQSMSGVSGRRSTSNGLFSRLFGRRK